MASTRRAKDVNAKQIAEAINNGVTPDVQGEQTLIVSEVSPGSAITLWGEDMVNLYQDQGYTPDDIGTLEQTALNVADLKGKSVQALIAIGKEISETKEAIPHGNFQWYIEERLNLSMDAAQRSMAAHSAVVKYPALLDVLTNINPTALAKIGQSKKITDDHVGLIVTAATGETVNIKDVDAVVAMDNEEVAERKEKKPPFKRNAAKQRIVVNALTSSIEAALGKTSSLNVNTEKASRQGAKALSRVLSPKGDYDEDSEIYIIASGLSVLFAVAYDLLCEQDGAEEE